MLKFSINSEFFSNYSLNALLKASFIVKNFICLLLLILRFILCFMKLIVLVLC
jgi:hypothetical protein